MKKTKSRKIKRVKNNKTKNKYKIKKGGIVLGENVNKIVQELEEKIAQNMAKKAQNSSLTNKDVIIQYLIEKGMKPEEISDEIILKYSKELDKK